MFSVWWLVCAIGIISVYRVEGGITAETCQVKPQDCVIETPTANMWYKERWVFDWGTKTCNFIIWHGGCPMQPDTNNFATENECYNACSGWA
ncbi:uncharacterized protein LOC123871169 isoform X3 [Maniola jurtina]|uniref:uncharacterized protein LOC123871169 isoform X3 n=1 Tax=Maniola jurtina TaxID=191418 RepID=UPI001E68E15C|nr:uncharacterized protein LOC123871169 isoform X3 [Maniola jurtina]